MNFHSKFDVCVYVCVCVDGHHFIPSSWANHQASTQQRALCFDLLSHSPRLLGKVNQRHRPLRVVGLIAIDLSVADLAEGAMILWALVPEPNPNPNPNPNPRSLTLWPYDPMTLRFYEPRSLSLEL